MEYKDLATLYHMDSSAQRSSNLERELTKRKKSASTFDIGFTAPSGSLFLAVPRELNSLTQKVLRRERRVSNLMRALPGIAGREVLRSLVIDEVVGSNSIENIYSTRRQIEETLRVHDEGDVKTKRFREFAKLYIDLSYNDSTIPQTPAEIRDIYDRIMAGERMEHPLDGKLFRKDGVVVTDGMKDIHVGITPESAIIDALEKMLALVNSYDVPELYSALISHYLFEHIHPFYDGNGRTGRYLLSLFLEAPLSKPTALSLSRVMAEDKAQYYQAFRNVEDPLNHGELTFFVITMHEFILKAQDQLIERLEQNIARFDELQAQTRSLSEEGTYSSHELSLIFGLAQQSSFGISPSMSLCDLADLIGLGTQQTRKYLASLEGREVLIKTRGRDPISFALKDDFIQEHFPDGSST